MKILVVGGAGYIGSVCAELLLDEGHSVAIFDNLSERHHAAIDSLAEFFEGDIQDRQSIEKALRKQKPDAVMHFAANALVGESMQSPSKYFRNNIANGLNLLDAMLSAGVVKTAFSSTCAIFAPPERVPIDETITKRPMGPASAIISTSSILLVRTSSRSLQTKVIFTISAPAAARVSGK